MTQAPAGISQQHHMRRGLPQRLDTGDRCRAALRTSMRLPWLALGQPLSSITEPAVVFDWQPDSTMAP
jgi:hypothetical protein